MGRPPRECCKYEVLRGVWKSVAVPSIMYGMGMTAWNESEIWKLEVGQNKVARMALNAPRYAALEVLRAVVDLGGGYWDLSPECFLKSPGSERQRRKWRSVSLTCNTRVYQSSSSCEKAVCDARISYSEVPVPTPHSTSPRQKWISLADVYSSQDVCVCKFCGT